VVIATLKISGKYEMSSKYVIICRFKTYFYQFYSILGLNGQLLDHSIKCICSIMFASVGPLNDAAANSQY